MEDKTKLQQAGLKATPTRLQLLSALRQGGRPMTAKELWRQNPDLELSTIYRSLQSLQDKGLIQSLNLEGESAAYYLLSGHHHYILCKGCHKLQAMDTCPIKELSGRTESGFVITEHKLELYGYCKDCQQKGMQNKPT